jgi:hypothetical protein
MYDICICIKRADRLSDVFTIQRAVEVNAVIPCEQGSDTCPDLNRCSEHRITKSILIFVSSFEQHSVGLS